jgi:spore maturation protein CgeB
MGFPRAPGERGGQIMKLVVFGLTISSSWGNGHATLWRGLCKALTRNGHRVIFFERNEPYYALNRDLFEIPGGDLILYDDWDAVRRRAEMEVADADVAMVTSYCPDGLAATDVIFEGRRAAKIFYDLDTPVTLSRLQKRETMTYIGPTGLAGFDLVLSYTGGGALDRLRTDLRAGRVAPLYGHVDPDAHRPQQGVSRYASDLSYLGTYALDRQATLSRLFIEPARALEQRRFAIAGAQYPDDFPWLPNIFFVRHLPPAEHPAFFSASRLTLNVTRKAMADMGWCPSGRVFEAAACGAPILSDNWEGIECFFQPGSEMLIAHTTTDVLNALELSDSELRRIAEAARARTLAEHTSECRVKEFENLVSEIRSIPSPGRRSSAMVEV